MSTPQAAISTRDLARVSAQARRLVAESHGTNLDPIYEALDHCLLTRCGEARPSVLSRLVPAPLGWIDMDGFGAATGPQLAARILCEADPSTRSMLAAVPADDIDRLVLLIATRLFRRMNGDVLVVASAMAALIAACGLEPFCGRMGRATRIQRLAS